MKIMIVDDSKVVRGKISQIIKQAGNTDLSISGIAKNGLEAINLCKQTMPDLATMDLTMPEVDGVEAISNLVNINPDILILVVSALSDKATAIEALKRGAHGFLCKPFSDAELTEALNELITAGVGA
jgi:two-component system chemotaxis response regulator CheY